MSCEKTCDLPKNLIKGFRLPLFPQKSIIFASMNQASGFIFSPTGDANKIFHAEIVVDTEKVKRDESRYQPIPVINDFKDADGNDCMKQTIQDNYNQIKEDVKQIVKDELARIAADDNLKHLIQK